jgi:DNA invertase Pin-like site-specific DNA recombinase
MSKLVGYARVSTQDQSLNAQRDALIACGCAVIFDDKASGSFASRPGLAAALKDIAVGDTFVVWKIDRLGRTVKGLIDLVQSLHDKGAHFRSLSDSLDTRGPQGKFFFHVMAAFAEMERDLIRERTRAGLKAAKARGRIGGRPTIMSDAKLLVAKERRKEGWSVREIADAISVSVPTVYRWLAAADAAQSSSQ